MRVLVIALIAGGCGAGAGPDVLVVSATRGYRHADAIDAARRVLPDALAARGLTIAWTEDPAALEDLAGVGVVAFLYTSGDALLTPGGRAELERFVGAGGGWVGLHSASDTEYLWPFYQALVVAPFAHHPAIQEADVVIEDHAHPATVALPARWRAADEWYDFAVNPRGPGVRVLATVDEASYVGGEMGADHPIAWAHARLGGRAFYSALGHVAARWDDPAFVAHVVGGVAWARDGESR